MTKQQKEWQMTKWQDVTASGTWKPGSEWSPGPNQTLSGAPDPFQGPFSTPQISNGNRNKWWLAHSHTGSVAFWVRVIVVELARGNIGHTRWPWGRPAHYERVVPDPPSPSFEWAQHQCTRGWRWNIPDQTDSLLYPCHPSLLSHTCPSAPAWALGANTKMFRCWSPNMLHLLWLTYVLWQKCVGASSYQLVKADF